MTEPSPEARQFFIQLFGYEPLSLAARAQVAEIDAYAARAAEQAWPPEHPTDAMIARGVAMHRTPRTGPDETLVHDIWQAMYDEWLANSAERK